MIHAQQGRPARRREARGEAILDVAMALLDAEGMEALTLQRLGRALDVVPAALYRYFPSKDALLAALQRRTVVAIHERLRAHLAEVAARHPRLAPAPRALAPLLSLARFYAEANDAMPQAFRLVQALLGDPRPLIADDEARPTAPLLGALLADVGALYEAARAAGALPAGDVAERTLVTWAALHGVVALRKIARFDGRAADTVALGEAAVGALLAGFGADAAALRAAARALAPTTVRRRR